MAKKNGRSCLQSGKKDFFCKSHYCSVYRYLIGGLLCVLSIQPLRWQSYVIVSPNAESIKKGSPLSSIKQRRDLVVPPQQPRILQYDIETNEAVEPQSNSTYSLLPPGTSYEIAADDGDDEESAKVCQFMHEWQTRIYPTCNHAHEINMRPETGSVVFINCGGSRCAFKIAEIDGENIVLKIPKYSKDFEARYYEKARKDGMAMERLHQSPYILDIYGYCGLSQLIEPGEDGGNTHDLIKTTRQRGEDTLPMVDKLKILYQLASGVADMHTFEEDGLVSLVHNDICCHQFIFSRGIYKLNDFHMAQFQRKNKNTKTVCTAGNGYSDYYKLIRSPEEIAVKLKQTKRGDVLLEKSDVYTLGNVMYYVFTMRWLFQGLDAADAAKKVTEGIRSPFPQKLLESPDRAIRAMRKAIEMCWTHDPEKRPTADEVRKFLGHELKAVLGVEELGVVRVTSIEPLPSGYSYTDSDFRTMFEDSDEDSDD